MHALCLGCRHEWVAVAEAGTVDLECPSCGLWKGVGKGLVGAGDGEQVFRCDCGSEALTAIITLAGKHRLRCMLCGLDHRDTVLG